MKKLSVIRSAFHLTRNSTSTRATVEQWQARCHEDQDSRLESWWDPTRNSPRGMGTVVSFLKPTTLGIWTLNPDSDYQKLSPVKSLEH